MEAPDFVWNFLYRFYFPVIKRLEGSQEAAGISVLCTKNNLNKSKHVWILFEKDFVEMARAYQNKKGQKEWSKNYRNIQLDTCKCQENFNFKALKKARRFPDMV